MCGINAVIKVGHPLEWIELMNNALFHRGPDEGGIFEDLDCGVRLGSRRLKIIDLEEGRMPYISPCGRYAMVFNGEVYNYSELKETCANYQFNSKSDGEVLFARLQKDGLDVLKDVQGMFSFAFWDKVDQRLWVGRDRMGIKPLFYIKNKDSLIISSEIRGLLAYPELNREMDLVAFDHYFSTLCVIEPHSIYKNIRRFPAAHVGEYHNGHWSIKPYWKISYVKKQQSESSWKQEIQKAFRRAVAKRLVADVPLGLLLSGGIDSSILAKVAIEEGGRPLVCHSMSFEGGDDESKIAQETAKRLGCPFHHHVLTEENFISHLPKIVRAFAEPFAGGLPLWFLCKEAKQSFTVGLTGTGGDEMFGNYGRVRHLLPGLGWRRGLGSWIKRDRFFPNKARCPEFKYLMTHGASMGYFYHEKNSSMKEILKKQLLKHQPDSTSRLYNQKFWELPNIQCEDRLFHLDSQIQLRDEFLYSQDVLSMDHSMELRVPFLDHEFVELMASVPTEIRSQWQDPKAWMRDVFSEELPGHVLNRPKSGFVIPYGRWLRENLRIQAEELFSPERIEQQGLFNGEKLSEVWGDHLKGQEGLEYALWSVFIFQMWYSLELREPSSR
jgi:asparagine synthase (glutamine-hydrolysing)